MKRVYLLLSRYLVLLLASVSDLWIFYAVFTPLTIYPVFFLLSLFYEVSLAGNVLILEGFPIHLVEACIAGSAYYLLLILNLTTPMDLKKRIYSLSFSFLLFLFVNILRILLFSILFINAFSLFNLTHLIFWYFLSGFLVFLIWLAEIKIFKIKQIPVYSDIRYLYNQIKKSKAH